MNHGCVNLQEMRSIFAYAETFTGGVSVASADINCDNINDILTGAGPGGASHVKAFAGFNLERILTLFAGDENDHNGVFVS
jgi:hypothetical protein